MKRLFLGFLFLLFAAQLNAQPTIHSATVSWTYTQGPDLAVGFNVYRSTTTGGPYVALNATPLPLATLSYVDLSGIGGTKYFYVVTAIDISSFESAFSPEVSATFLAVPAAPGGTAVVVK